MGKRLSTFFLVSLSITLALAQTKPAPIKLVLPSSQPAKTKPIQPTTTNPSQSSNNGIESKEFAAGDFYQMKTIAGNGNLTIVKSPTPGTKVSVTKPKAGSRCELQIFKSPEFGLMIRSASKSGDTCTMDGNISVPNDVVFKGSLESGSFKINGVKIVSELTMGSGDITLEGIASAPQLTIKRGSINLERWDNGVTFKVLDNANVRCNFANVTKIGAFSIESRDGLTELNIPKNFGDAPNTNYDINFKTEMGELIIKRN